MIEFMTISPEQTYTLGQKLAKIIQPGLVICMEGDLGAGKTLFVQGIASGLQVTEEVTSPTFSLMNIYQGTYSIYHFDLYRLETMEELEDIGFYEYAQQAEAVVIIEWPDKFPEALPDDCLWIAIARGEQEHERRFTVRLKGEKDRSFYEEMKQNCRF